MQSVPREWLDFLRQQFPKDSRIQLTEIGGNPRPISPGSTGKLDYIDDAGQFHVKWDNGCTLALVLGEDRFSVYLPEPQTFKLYMPLTADFYRRDEWGDMSEDGEEWDGHTLMDYEGQILSALVKNRVPEENESGLMRWYGEDDSVDHKVRSAVFTVEVRNRQLWGVAECRVAGELTPEELTILKSTWVDKPLTDGAKASSSAPSRWTAASCMSICGSLMIGASRPNRNGLPPRWPRGCRNCASPPCGPPDSLSASNGVKLATTPPTGIPATRKGMWNWRMS